MSKPYYLVKVGQRYVCKVIGPIIALTIPVERALKFGHRSEAERVAREVCGEIIIIDPPEPPVYVIKRGRDYVTNKANGFYTRDLRLASRFAQVPVVHEDQRVVQLRRKV